MAQLYTNNAYGVLASSIGPSDTTITLMSGDGARFPSPGAGDFFLLTLIALDGNASEASWEIVRVTARSGDTLTVVRAQEGTTGLIWPAASRAELRATAGTFLQFAASSDVQASLDLKANLASPALTGAPTAPTASVGTNTTQIATTAYVRGEVAALVASAPGTLDTLNELATALGNDPNFATTVTNSLAGKAPLTGAGTSGTWGISITGNAATATLLGSFDNRTISPSEQTAGRIGVGFTSWANNDSSPYADYIHFRSYTDSSGGNDNLVMFRKDAIGMRIWQQGWGSASAYSSYADVLHSGNYNSYALPLTGGTLTGPLSAPNFRDGAGTFNVNLGSGGTEGRGAAAGYSGGAYGGIGYNVRHTATSEQYIAPTGDTVSYLRFEAGGFRFFGAAAGAVGRTVTFTGTGNANLDASGNWYTAGQMYATGSQHLVLNTGNYSSYALPLTGGTLTGSRPIQLSTNDGALFITGNSGGWSMGTYFKGSSGTIRAGFGALGSANDLTYAWIGTAHNSAWMTLNPSAIESRTRTFVSVDGRGTAYTQSNLEIYTGDNTPPGISFHRGGYSATLLYESDGELYANAWTTRAQTGKLLSSGNISSYALPLSGGVLSGAIRASQITAGGSTNTDANLGVQGTSHLTGTIYYGGTVGNVNTWSSLQSSSGGHHTLSVNTFVVNRTGYGSISGTYAGEILRVNEYGYAIAGGKFLADSWVQSDRDFPNGTLITTDINYATTSGDPFVLEIRGNSYGNLVPLDLQYQGYIYGTDLYNHGGLSNGLNITGLVAINNGGNLCFWFPSQGYWNGYYVRVYVPYATYPRNRVTSITHVAKPTTAKQVDLSANIRQSLHSGNYTSYAMALRGDSLNNADWNNLTGIGCYRTAPDGADANGPPINQYGNLLVFGNDNGRTQLQAGHDGRLAWRTKWNASDWTSWNFALDSGNYSSYALPLSGGTLTGNVYYTNLVYGASQTYGIFDRSAYLDTVNGRGTDPLELNYYDGGPVKIGSGTYGSKSLYAAGIYDSGYQVLHAGNFTSYAMAGAGFSANQSLNTTNSPTFSSITATGNLWAGYHGGNAYNGGSNASLYFGGDTGGAYRIWTSFNDFGGNYTKLNIDWHTGIRIGAYWAYGGVRFYNDSIGYGSANGYGDKVFSVAEGDSNVRVYNNLYIQGASLALHAGNYNSYAPTLGGTGATGTWGISVTGSAGSVAASGITGQTGMWTSAARPGPYRLYRNEDDSAYNVQTTWSPDRSGYWSLRGYYNDTYHAPCYVAYSGYADNAGTVASLSVHGGRNNEANKVVRTDGNGYLQTGYINSSNGDENNASSPARVWGTNGSDSYLRTYQTSSLSVGTATNGRYVYDNGTYSGSAAYREASSMHVYYAYLGRHVYNNGAYSGSGWVEPSDLGVRYAARSQRANGNFYIDDNYGCGIVGAYASTRYQGVFAMGDSYKLPADGTSAGNLYGIAWSYPSAGGVAGNLDSHGMLVLINGGFGSCMSYSIVAAGNVTAYSDERLKTNWRSMPENFVERLAQVKVGIYDRIDGEQITQVGIGAQSFQRLLPEAITKAKDEMGTLSVSYGNAAMASAVELAKEIVAIKRELEALKARLH